MEAGAERPWGHHFIRLSFVFSLLKLEEIPQNSNNGMMIC